MPGRTPHKPEPSKLKPHLAMLATIDTPAFRLCVEPGLFFGVPLGAELIAQPQKLRHPGLNQRLDLLGAG